MFERHLRELLSAWKVEFSRLTDDRNLVTLRSRTDDTMFVYVGDSLAVTLARAWAGEPPDTKVP